MKRNNLRLFVLLAFLAASNLALVGDFGGFEAFLDPECDCEDEQKSVLVTVTPAELSLAQGETKTSIAEFLVGADQKAATWTMRKASTKLFKASSLSTSTGATTTISVTAADNVIPEENWDQGAFCETDSPTVFGTGQNKEGKASAPLTLTVWGTQLYWANPDGSVRRWWNSVNEFLNPFAAPPPKETLVDGGSSTSLFLKMNMPAGVNAADWDMQVVTRPVQRNTMVDSVLMVYSPFASTHDPSEYIETPTVEVVNGLVKVTFKSKTEFPGNAFADGGGEMPYEVVLRRKSDGLTVRRGSSLSFWDVNPYI
jgi:hypothetical protein